MTNLGVFPVHLQHFNAAPFLADLWSLLLIPSKPLLNSLTRPS